MRQARWVFAVLLFSAVQSARADSAAQARQILERATTVSRSLKAISYDAVFEAEGLLAQRFPRFEGKVLAARDPGSPRARFIIEGVSSPAGATEAAGFKLASDGENIFNIEDRAKTFLSGKIADAKFLPNNPLFQPRFLHDAPYQTELSMSKITLDGTVEIDGVKCDIISVNHNSDQTKGSRLFIGAEDGVLRRIETMLVVGPGQTETNRVIFTVSGLSTQPKIDSLSFKLDCPAGYEKKDISALAINGGIQAKSAPGLLEAGSAAPDWELAGPDGKKVRLSSLRGKVVVLDFWASWCGPCKMAMPGIQKVHEHFQGKPVVVFGMNCRERGNGTQAAMQYVQQMKFTYPQLINTDAAANDYRVQGIPTFYIIDTEGKIAWGSRGFLASNDQLMEQTIDGLLPKAGRP